jgi:hypothetical protein
VKSIERSSILIRPDAVISGNVAPALTTGSVAVPSMAWLRISEPGDLLQGEAWATSSPEVMERIAAQATRLAEAMRAANAESAAAKAMVAA